MELNSYWICICSVKLICYTAGLLRREKVQIASLKIMKVRLVYFSTGKKSLLKL